MEVKITIKNRDTDTPTAVFDYGSGVMEFSINKEVANMPGYEYFVMDMLQNRMMQAIDDLIRKDNQGSGKEPIGLIN